jgi:hypothetical protein
MLSKVCTDKILCLTEKLRILLSVTFKWIPLISLLNKFNDLMFKKKMNLI